MTTVLRTIRDKCKRCYNCVRQCPARAVRVEEGQAAIVKERCIACGNCYRVCAQHAKEIEDHTPAAYEFLSAGGTVVAALAPSFPAAFHPVRPLQVVSAVRKLGFTHVMEVAFGADLVARRYKALVADGAGGSWISSPCPALVSFIEKYHPALVPRLAPLVSPMIALARAVRQKHCPEARIVFIGPCTAKKNEIRDPEVAGAIDAVVTFDGLRKMFSQSGIDPAAEDDSEVDPPRAALGRAFALSGGLLRTADVPHDVLQSDILVTDGMGRVQDILRDMEEGRVHVRFGDLLFCEGCVSGPVMQADSRQFPAGEVVSAFVRRGPLLTPEEAEAILAEYDDVDLSRRFHPDPVDPPLPSEEEIRAVLAKVNKFGPEDELNCGACGYGSCRDKAVAVCQGLAEEEMCLPYLIEEMERAVSSLEASHTELANTQERLIHAEKLATIGQLAAGVAHQVNNPLGTVLLYGHMMLRQWPKDDPRRDDLQTIVSEAMRCKNIVVDLLNFARQNRMTVKLFDLNTLLGGVLDLALRNHADRVQLTRDLAEDLPQVTGDPDQLTQVFLNLVENACEAMPHGGRLTVTTARSGDDRVHITFTDTGEGISGEVLDRIFDPFFTTKPVGQGTGLGLAIAKGIIKVHNGDITAANQPEGGARFEITLPIADHVVEQRPVEMIG